MWLDNDLDRAADWHFKEHQKLILEAGQMLATALNWHGLDNVSWYDSTHTTHPMTIWARTSAENWHLLREYMSSLHDSFYGYDYDGLRRSYERGADLDLMDEKGEIHSTFKKVVRADCGDVVRLVFPSHGVTARPRCFGHGYEENDELRPLTDAYRDYYRYNARERSDRLTWREVPEWSKK
jgi:hypothetical protein